MAVQLIYTAKGQPYIDQYNETAKKMATERDTYRQDQANLRDAYRKQATAERDTSVNTTNQNYDKSAKQNYINYMQAQKRLPSELNALGIRGGASESSLIRLGSNYGTNVANNESARGTAIAGINQAYEKGLSDYDRDYQTSLSDYDKDYNSRLASAYATAYQNQINWEKEQQQKDLEYFSGAIEGLYGDTESYDNLIAQLEASKDPNKEYKVMLARKARQTLIDKIGEAYGGGGGGYSYGGGGGGYGGYSSGGYSSSSGGGVSAKGITNYVASVAKKSANAGAKAANSGSSRKTTTIKGDTYYVTKKGSYRSR